jgi:dihydropteroate synthase
MVMGIINATPDSLYEDSRWLASSGLEEHVKAMEAAGAAIVDIGAESSRPGSIAISQEAELQRLIPVLQRVRACTTLPISVDTRRGSVARVALECGADIINDIYAFRQDSSLFNVVLERQCPVVLLHMQGEPATMQQAPVYQNVLQEVSEFLVDRARALIDQGFPSERIIIDPGIGFGKTLEHNLQLLRHLNQISNLGFPVLLGHSRKGFIGTILANNAVPRSVEDRLYGTIAVGIEAVRQGVRILRVHDVAATVDSLRLFNALQQEVV